MCIWTLYSSGTKLFYHWSESLNEPVDQRTVTPITPFLYYIQLLNFNDDSMVVITKSYNNQLHLYIYGVIIYRITTGKLLKITHTYFPVPKPMMISGKYAYTYSPTSQLMKVYKDMIHMIRIQGNINI